MDLPKKYSIKWGECTKVCSVYYKGGIVGIIYFDTPNKPEINIIDDFTFEKHKKVVNEIFEKIIKEAKL